MVLHFFSKKKPPVHIEWSQNENKAYYYIIRRGSIIIQEKNRVFDEYLSDTQFGGNNMNTHYYIVIVATGFVL